MTKVRSRTQKVWLASTSTRVSGTTFSVPKLTPSGSKGKHISTLMAPDRGSLQKEHDRPGPLLTGARLVKGRVSDLDTPQLS